VALQGHGPAILALLEATVGSHGPEETKISQAVPESMPIRLLVLFRWAQRPGTPCWWRLK